jgi:hypothetical protein
MSEQNPYSPPRSIAQPSRLPLGALDISTLILIGFQLLLSVVYSRVAWAMMSIGKISVLTFLAVVLSAALLALGGLLLAKAPRMALYAFLLAALLGTLAFVAWHQPLAPLLGAVLAAGASIVSMRRARSFAKV